MTFINYLVLSLFILICLVHVSYNSNYIEKHGRKLDRVQYWPKQKIYYVFDEGFDVLLKHRVLHAMSVIEKYTCLRFYKVNKFTKRYKNGKFVSIKQLLDPGCRSSVGYRPPLMHMKLFMGCTLYTVVHEFLHVLGFFHEHSRPDRNDWVKTIEKNIRPRFEHNFRRIPDWQTMKTKVGFDFNSVLMYRAKAFLRKDIKDPNAKTISPLPRYTGAETMMGQRKGLSAFDIARVNRMYKCFDHYVAEEIFELTGAFADEREDEKLNNKHR